MIPVLFKKNEQQFRSYGLGPIHDIISPKVTRERNGQYLLYFQYPQDAEFADVFEEDMRIKSDAGVRTKWQTFEITRVVRKEGQLIEVFAKHISQSLLKDALNPSVSVRSLNAEQALRIWNNNRIGDEEFDVWSDISTTSSTNWDIRDVSNAFEALAGVQGSILDVWGGEYEFDNKLIRLHKEMGRKSPVPLEYGRNITELEQDQQEDNVYTSVYPFATYTAEGDNQPKTVTLPERYIDGKYLEFHNKRKIQVVDFSGEFESDDIPTVSRLRTLTENYLNANEVGLPHENLKVEYIDLSKTLDYQEFQTMEEVELNDRLPIFYPKFGITNENAKVVVINYDPVKEENISIELGVIGQSFRTVTTGGLGSRLDRVEKQQDATNNYIVNAKGNRIWFETPNEDMEHKIGDTWFEKNGPHDRIRVWNGNQWETIIDSEDIDKNAKAIAAQQQAIEEAKRVADDAVNRIDNDIANKFTSIDEEILAIESISNSAQANAQTALTQSIDALGDASLALTNAQTAINTAGSAISSIQDINMEIDKINGTLAIKADSSTVNAIDGTVSNLSTEVGIIAGELSLKANSSTVDTLTGRVSTAESGITANANAIKLKASQSSVDTLTGRVNVLGAQIDVTAGQISSKVWNTDIQTAVDGIEVGGRNLYINNESSIERSGAGIYVFNHAETPDGFYAVGDKALTNKIKIKDVVTGNGFYTVSFDLRGSQNGGGAVYVNICGQGHQTIRTPSDNDWGRFSLTVNVTNYDTESGVNYVEFTPGWAYIWVNKIKIEKGNKATDWTPAPEDTTALINHVESELTQKHDTIAASVSSVDGRVAQQKITLDSIVSTVSDIQEDAKGTTTLLNQTVSTVNTQSSTLATIRTDLDGKATITQFNTLTSTVNGTIQRVGNAEGKITQIETNISGLQTTVASKASQTQVTQLSNLVDTKVTARQVNESILADKRYKDTRNDNRTPSWYCSNYTKETVMEFKYLSTMGISGEGTYGVLETVVPWDDSSGGGIKQTLRTDYGVWEREQNGSSAWKAWRKTADQTWVGAQVSILENNINLRVKKGDVVSQLNIDANRTLISSSKILLNANTVIISGTAWMDGTVIANASIDGAKIQDATIGSAKIASLDVSKLSGNTSEFVMTNWNNINDSISIDGSGITMIGNNAYRKNVNNAEGISLYGDYGAYRKAGAIGYFRTDPDTPDKNANVVEVEANHHHYVGMAANEGYSLVLGYRRSGWGDRFYRRSVIVSGDTGRVTMFGSLSMRNLDGISWLAGGSSINEVSRHLVIRSKGQLRIYNSIDSYKIQIGASVDLYSDLNMNNNNIYNNSDVRLKKNITPTGLKSLDGIKQWKFVDYEWRDERLKGTFMGVIAQDTPEIALYNEETGFYAINSSKQLMMTTHAVQQLAIMEENTNKVASQALQLVESIKSEIDELREENRDLRNRIEELESAA